MSVNLQWIEWGTRLKRTRQKQQIPEEGQNTTIETCQLKQRY